MTRRFPEDSGHVKSATSFRALWLNALLALACSLVSTAAPAEENPGKPPAAIEGSTAAAPSDDDLKNPEWIQAGKTRFVQTCAYCHGTRGEAGKTRSFETREAWDPQVIHDTIANGRVNGPNVMPSWNGSIPDDMIWKIVAYIKSLSAGYKSGR